MCISPQANRAWGFFCFQNLSETMFSYLKSLLPPKPPVYGEKEDRSLCRRAVSRVSSGSVLVQQGHYVTQQDIKARKQSLLKRHV